MKLLSIAVPCYNSAAYMKKCIETLLYGGDDVEILIVNDGSSDDTGKIADAYAALYPNIVRVIHKENGGHGSAVNTGLEHATGLYFKVVDSDDCVREEPYRRILHALEVLTGGDKRLDMLISNFVYNKEGERRHKVMRYKHALPVEEMFTWKDVKHFRKGQYMLMHSVIFRTKLLRESGLKLPEHTFYVDNLYVFQPLPFVENMYYLDVNFYDYTIGREGQSVNEAIMISRIDQQIAVNKLMYDYFTENLTKIMAVKKRYQYMFSYLEIITTISSVMLVKSGTEENLEKKQALWRYFRKKDLRVYLSLRLGLLGRLVNMPGKSGRAITLSAYKIAQKFFHFN
ncbi:MAG: glycosyltransferase family 2 protein [Lachnospiraceae bacterium]|nr:glycosyltransferase family 2 protein [Lachnospiraceae bacterium]